MSGGGRPMREGQTLVHRAPAALKLWCLALVAVAIMVFRSAPVALGALVAALALAGWVGVSSRALLRRLRALAVIGALLLVITAFQRDFATAIAVVGSLLALVVLAETLHSSTTTTELLDTISGGLRPFRQAGVDPELVGLSLSLALRALPEASRLAVESRDAARARGLERSLRALAVPLVVRGVGLARARGEALEARGIGDD